jgi:arylsulfatase A-like enzyme
MHSERTLRRLPILLLGVAGAVSACSSEPAGPPNVVLAVLDTVRADHLSCYGYALPTTPTIDALAENGERYVHCQATAPWTLPSHASMLTGRYPFQHGAQARRDAGGKVVEYPLSPQSKTLAEALKDEGYRTGAVVANGVYLGPRLGFGQGFDHYDPKLPRSGPRKGPDVTRLGLEWVDSGEAEDGQPFFLFLNYMDAHRPYNVDPLPAERAAGLPPPDPENPQALLNLLVKVVLTTDQVPSPELVRRVKSQYDYGLAHADLAIEKLIEGLKERGVWENTLFVLTSDHGEYFGEHDLVEHSKDVYEEALRVPLIVHPPGGARGSVVEERTTIAAIPYIVSLAMPGEVSARLRTQFTDPGTKLAFAELRYTRAKDLQKPYGARFNRERTVIYSEHYKAIYSTDGQHELYDLEADPGEHTNLFEALEHRDVGRALIQQAEQQKLQGEAAGPASAAVEYTEEEIENLRKLGYMDGGDDDE